MANLYDACAALLVGFEEIEIVIEETLTRQLAVSVLVLQGQADREFIVSVQTLADTATGLPYNNYGHEINTLLLIYTCSFIGFPSNIQGHNIRTISSQPDGGGYNSK